MKKLIIIPILFICFVVQGQIKEKWIDTDSLNAVKAEIDSGNVDYLTIKNSEPVDSITNINDVTFNDTLLFLNVNWIIKLDSSYATNKSWNWIYNLGKP